MTISDAHVVSVPMSPHGDSAGQAGLDRQLADMPYRTETSLAELLRGVEVLPPGKRKDGVGSAFAERAADQRFGSGVLPSDQSATLTQATPGASHALRATRALRPTRATLYEGGTPPRRTP